MVYHYTKRAMLVRLLANKGPVIYVVHLNRYFFIPPWYYLVVTFCDKAIQNICQCIKSCVTIDLILYRCLPWCNHMDYFFVSYHFIYLMAQSAPHWWGMFFTQQTSCLPHVFLIHSSWYIGIYTVDTLLYSLRFTNCIIPFLPLLSIHPWVFTWVLQPELLLRVITSCNRSNAHTKGW